MALMPVFCKKWYFDALYIIIRYIHNMTQPKLMRAHFWVTVCENEVHTFTVLESSPTVWSCFLFLVFVVYVCVP